MPSFADFPATDTRDAMPIGNGCRVFPFPAARLTPHSVGETPVSVSYRKLNSHSNRLARLLLAAGAGPGIPVAAVMPHSADLVLALWAIAKTGAVQTLIDPMHPGAMPRESARRFGHTAGVTTCSTRARLPESIRWLVIDDPETVERCAAAPSAPVTDADRGTAIDTTELR